VFFCS